MPRAVSATCTILITDCVAMIVFLIGPRRYSILCPINNVVNNNSIFFQIYFKKPFCNICATLHFRLQSKLQHIETAHMEHQGYKAESNDSCKYGALMNVRLFYL